MRDLLLARYRDSGRKWMAIFNRVLLVLCLLKISERRSVSMFFFLLIRRPPRSTLFPYPTLCRSRRGPCRDESRLGCPSSQAKRSAGWPWPRNAPATRAAHADRSSCGATVPRPAAAWPPRPDRSEEHTSELQSPDHLLCRLLLEKK